MSALLCLAAVAGVRADDFAALRAEAAGRTVRLAPGTQLEALVVSDYRSQNMELNPNVSWDKVDLGENLRRPMSKARTAVTASGCVSPASTKTASNGATACGSTWAAVR